MTNQSGHSALVIMRLLLNGRSLPVVQMGPDFLILQSATEHPPGDATLELCVDASERRWQVQLPNGISSLARTVTNSRADGQSRTANALVALTPKTVKG